MKFRADKSI